MFEPNLGQRETQKGQNEHEPFHWRFLFTRGIGVTGTIVGHRVGCQTERTHVRNPACFPVGVVFGGQPGDTGRANASEGHFRTSQN